MLDQFVLDLGEGHIGSKAGHHPLQGPRTPAMAYFGPLHKGANVLVSVAILNLFYADFTKGAVPLEFFLPARRTPFSCPTPSAALTACPVAQACNDS